MLAPALPPAATGHTVLRVGQAALVAALALGLLAVGALAWSAPELLPLAPAAVVALAAGVVLFQYPRANFVVWLSGLVFLLTSEEGIQVHEALYGLYFYGYLAHWYGRRLVLYRSPIVRGGEDVAAALLMTLGLTLAVGLGIAFGASAASIFSDVLSFSFILIYFPIKDFCVRDRHGPVIAVSVLTFAAIIVSIQSALDAQSTIATAETIWDVVNVRVVGNELLVMVVTVLLLAVLSVVPDKKRAALLIVPLGIVLGGLLLTKARTYWGTFFVTSFLLVLFLHGKGRQRLVLRGLFVVALLIGAALIVFGPNLLLVGAGVIDRLFKLGGVTDISMAERYVEAGAALQSIRLNPFVGHGFGTSFFHYNILYGYSTWSNYIHIGYVAVWFKLGLWGLVLYGVMWLRNLLLAFRAANSALPPIERALATGVAVCLVGVALPAFTVSLFFEDDTLATFAALAALGSALYYRARNAARAPDGGPGAS